MNKKHIHSLIIQKLTEDQNILFQAAKTAHDAAMDGENIPDNKYDTLSLEASYVAQGQANRAEEIRKALEIYRHLSLRAFDEDTPIAQTALVTLEDEKGVQTIFFIGPRSGGIKLVDHKKEITVITPHSPLGKVLVGKELGDLVEFRTNRLKKEYEIVAVQ